MADQPVTREKLINADIDVENLGKAVNEKGMVNPRYGDPYLTLPSAIQQVIEAGGFEPFATEAELKSTTPILPKKASYALDTHKIWLWSDEAWSDTGLSAIDQAKEIISGLIENRGGNFLLALKDSDANNILVVDLDGSLYLPSMRESVQHAISRVQNQQKDTSEKIASNSSARLLSLTDADNIEWLFVDSNGKVYLSHLNDSIQDSLSDLMKKSKSSSKTQAFIEGSYQPDKALYATLPADYVANKYQWYRNGLPIHNAIKPIYIPPPSDIGAIYSVEVDDVVGGKIIRDNSGVTIGGISLEQSGMPNTIYNGFTLSCGDDFTSLDIISPQNPLGRWFTTRTYLHGKRTNNTALRTMYDTDPLHTGNNDSNRGVPVGFDNMRVNNSILSLQARAADSSEIKHFHDSNQKQVAAMLSSIGAFSFFAGPKETGDTIIEWLARWTMADSNPAGWHPSLWTQTSTPSTVFGSNEIDVIEGSSKLAASNYNHWNDDGSRAFGTAIGKNKFIFDGLWHKVSAVINKTETKIYIDDELIDSYEGNLNSFSEPAYLLMTSHVYASGYLHESYSEEEWDSFTKGATLDVDWVRVWRRSGTSHIKPQVIVNPVNIDFGSVGSIQLPSKTNLWGRDDVVEHVQVIATEENEPFSEFTSSFNSLPAGVVYNDVSRLITIDTALATKAGRINFVIYGYLQDGSSCEPARTFANIGPNIAIDSINLSEGSFDLYAVCDCGVLVTDGSIRTKTIEVTGLPDGISYNQDDGMLEVIAPTDGVYEISVACTNSVGQTLTKSLNLKIG